MRIFLSYRRADPSAAAVVHRLHERLVARYGQQQVFLDVDSIPPGRDFRGVINDEIAKADLLLVLIGNTWSRMTRSRAADAVDYVRVEIECAFRQKLPVIPLLVGHATRQPREIDLPKSIKQLAFCSSLTLDPGRDFDTHVTRLVGDIERHYGPGESTKRETEPEDDGKTAAREKLKKGQAHERRKEFQEAARLYREAAVAGVTTEDDPLSYLQGLKIRRPKIFGGDKTFLREIEARAEKGEAEALFALAEYHRDALMSVHDWPDLLKMYEKLAAQQFVPAMFQLALQYEYGCPEGDSVIGQDDEMAARWYRAAAETILRA